MIGQFFNSTVYHGQDSQEEIQEKIKKIQNSGIEVRNFDILNREGDGFKIVASFDENKINNSIDDLNYVIKYSNNSNYNLVGVNLTIKLEGEMYDISSLDTKGGYYDNSNNTITWNASTVSDFANLAPNKKGQVSFRIKLKNS